MYTGPNSAQSAKPLKRKPLGALKKWCNRRMPAAIIFT
jgi:hypothetical protein